MLRVPVPMRDGVRLSANVFLPAQAAPRPAILVRTPYGKGTALIPNYQAFVDRGYAVIVEDGVVTHLAVEPGRGLGVSSAESILNVLSGS